MLPMWEGVRTRHRARVPSRIRALVAARTAPTYGSGTSRVGREVPRIEFRSGVARVHTAKGSTGFIRGAHASSPHMDKSVSASFPRTMRALQTDGMNPTVLGLILVTALITLWCCWLVLGQVSVYEISTTARLEVERVHPVAAAVAGRIVRSYVSLGRQVRTG